MPSQLSRLRRALNRHPSAYGISALGLILATVLAARPFVRGWSYPPSAVAHQIDRGRRNDAKSAFDLTESLIPKDQILNGGPPKDGIPALTKPKFVAAGEAKYLADEDRVIGVTRGDAAKAYPLRILDRHEVVNDEIGGARFAVTYCPLCDSSAIFARDEGDDALEFGVSGLLYNSNVLMYDRRGDGPESLWSQMGATAVAGDRRGQPLRRLPIEVTTWLDWRTRHPNTQVLSLDKGRRRNYTKRAYQSYFDSPSLIFDVEPLDERLPLKTPVLGVLVGDEQRAYPVSAFSSKEPQVVVEQLGGRTFELRYDPKHESLRIVRADDGVQWMYSFWFAWAAFYPETRIYADAR